MSTVRRTALLTATVALGLLATPPIVSAQPYRCGGRPPGAPASRLCHYECVQVQGPDPGPMRPPVTSWAWRQVCANPSWQAPPRGPVSSRAGSIVVVPEGRETTRLRIRRRGQVRWLNPQPEPPRPVIRYRRRASPTPWPGPSMSPGLGPAIHPRGVAPR